SGRRRGNSTDKTCSHVNIGNLSRGVLQVPDSLPSGAKIERFPTPYLTISPSRFSQFAEFPVAPRFLLRNRNRRPARPVCGRKRQLKQNSRIQVDPLPPHRQMQVRASRPACATAQSDDIASADFLPFLHLEL